MRYTRLATLLFILAACSNDKINNTDVYIIDLAEAFKNPQEVKLSQFVQSIEFITLEETEQTILFRPIIEVTDEYIIARNSGPSAIAPIPLFDRHTGEFIRAVGKIGRGPGEFQIGNTPLYNHISKHLYGIGYHNDIVIYDLDGNHIQTFKLPVMIDERVPERWGTPSVRLDQFIEKDIFVAHIENTTGYENRFIVLFNSDSIIKTYPNSIYWERTDWRKGSPFGGASFYHWNNKLHVKSEFNDTLFQVTIDSLIPKYIFKLKEYSPPPNIQQIGLDQDEFAKYFFLSNFSETNEYLFFQLRFARRFYCCYYNKSTRETVIAKTEDALGSAFIDDVTNFMTFRPEKITMNNEMIYRMNAQDIVKWRGENPEIVKSLGENMDWLKNMNLESNPVVAIAKLK